jgi:hypothetical protein
MRLGKLRQRVTRTRGNGYKLPEFRRLQRPLWIRRVLVRAQEGQLEGPIPLWWIGPFRFFARCYRVSRFAVPPVNSSTAISGRAPSRMGKLIVPMPQLTYTCELRC